MEVVLVAGERELQLNLPAAPRGADGMRQEGPRTGLLGRLIVLSDFWDFFAV